MPFNICDLRGPKLRPAPVLRALKGQESSFQPVPTPQVVPVRMAAPVDTAGEATS
jgi:hypothetical protein